MQNLLAWAPYPPPQAWEHLPLVRGAPGGQAEPTSAWGRGRVSSKDKDAGFHGLCLFPPALLRKREDSSEEGSWLYPRAFGKTGACFTFPTFS